MVAQMVKRLPTMQETRVQSLGREDLLEEEMATHSGILAMPRIPWLEETGGLRSMGLQRVKHDLAIKPPPKYIAHIYTYIHTYEYTCINSSTCIL